MVTRDNNIHRIKILSDGFRGSVNRALVDVHIREVYHRVVPVGHDRHNRIDILIAGIGLFMDVVKPKAHIPHGEGYIITVSVFRVAVNDLLLRDIYQVGALVLHSLDRLIIIGLIVPGIVAVSDKIVLKVRNMLILFIKIGGVAVNQIPGLAAGVPIGRCGDFRDAADMIHVGMRADDKVQMRDTQYVDHIPCNVLAVAHGNLVGILF